MNFFKQAATGANNMQEKYLGPNYPYHKMVKTPNELGMSGDGNLDALANDITGIINYTKILVSGTGDASKSSNPKQPLGNKFFLETAGKCKDYKTKRIVNRSMYVNNIPSVKMPIISNLTNVKFNGFRGIVPGIMHDMYAINPVKMFGAFMQGNEPLCAEVKLDHITFKNGKENIDKNKKGFVPINELIDLVDNLEIPSNTVTREMRQALEKSFTKEGFENFCKSCHNDDNDSSLLMEKIEKSFSLKESDNFTNLYFAMFAMLLAYLTIKMINK